METPPGISAQPQGEVTAAAAAPPPVGGNAGGRATQDSNYLVLQIPLVTGVGQPIHDCDGVGGLFTHGMWECMRGEGGGGSFIPSPQTHTCILLLAAGEVTQPFLFLLLLVPGCVGSAPRKCAQWQEQRGTTHPHCPQGDLFSESLSELIGVACVHVPPPLHGSSHG